MSLNRLGWVIVVSAQAGIHCVLCFPYWRFVFVYKNPGVNFAVFDSIIDNTIKGNRCQNDSHALESEPFRIEPYLREREDINLKRRDPK